MKISSNSYSNVSSSQIYWVAYSKYIQNKIQVQNNYKLQDFSTLNFNFNLKGNCEDMIVTGWPNMPKGHERPFLLKK